MRLVLLLLLIAAGCLRPAKENVERDRRVGSRSEAGATVREVDGLASVRSLTEAQVVLWANAPVLHLEVQSNAAAFSVVVLNALPDAELVATAGDGTPLAVETGATDLRTRRRFVVALRPGEPASLRLAPPDAADRGPFRFGVLSDVQEAIGRVSDVFDRMNEDPELRFVISTGDLVQNGTRAELERVQREMERLRVPLYATVGNHEAAGDFDDWHELFGPFNSFFEFRGVYFSLVDSSTATVDPRVHDRLVAWLDALPGEVHVFATHIPLLDPSGIRQGGFRSRAEAAELAALLAREEVDVMFFGHIHSFYSFSTADVPSYISGGGGALPERLDGIGRHYLAIDVTPGERIDQVTLVRVD